MTGETKTTPTDPTAAPEPSLRAWFRASPHAAMTALCNGFHVLAGLPGVDPWDPTTFARDIKGAGSGKRWAISFVLSVWNPTSKWRNVPRFDLHDALATWDADNRKAFLAWANDPWWP